MDVALPLFRHASKLCILAIPLVGIFRIVLGLQDDGPTCGENIVMDVEVIRLEEKAPKHRQYRQILAVGEVNDVLRGRHLGQWVVLKWAV